MTRGIHPPKLKVHHQALKKIPRGSISLGSINPSKIRTLNYLGRAPLKPLDLADSPEAYSLKLQPCVFLRESTRRLQRSSFDDDDAEMLTSFDRRRACSRKLKQQSILRYLQRPGGRRSSLRKAASWSRSLREVGRMERFEHPCGPVDVENLLLEGLLKLKL